MAMSSLDAMETIRQIVEEVLGVDHLVQVVGSRRSLLGVSDGPISSDDFLFIMAEVSDAYEKTRPRRVYSEEERAKGRSGLD